MNNLRTWWRGKSRHKKQNWLLLALALCFVGSGFVEAGAWVLVIAAMLPAGVMVYLECWE
ncbi:MAG: hypothetical protein EXR84_14045 [Gammaproteobacteria bacterium]|nr:hypothetical protein [Gammaproteobacteria bacterium]